MSIDVNKKRYAKIDMKIISLYELIQWADKGTLDVKSAENRNLRWTLEGKSQLMESVLEGIPVQSVYLAETEEGRLKIVDGAQRIKTVLEFVENKFALMSEREEWNRHRFLELHAVEQRRIEDFQIIAYVIRNDNDENIQELVFDRLNLYQQKFSSQEIRNYKYRNQGIPFIRYLAEDRFFLKTLWEKEINFNALQQQELVLRFMSFYFKGYRSYSGNMKNFMDDTLKNYADYQAREGEFEQVFRWVFKEIDTVWENDAFLIRYHDRRVNLALYDIITYSFANCRSCDLKYHTRRIRDLQLKLLEENTDFRDAVKGTSNTSKRKVKMRFEIWLDELKTILGEKDARQIFSEEF